MGRDQAREDWAAWMPGRRVSAKPTAQLPGAGAADREPQPAGTGTGPGPAPPVVGRTGSARREATRQRVLDAALEVFAERGVIGGTVEDICERAGFTRGAFYGNFTDRDDLLAALIQRECARVLEHLDVCFAPADPVGPDASAADAAAADAALASIVDRILAAVPAERRRSLVRAELEIHAIRRPEVAGTFLAADHRVRARIAAFLEAAMARNGRQLIGDPLDLVDASVAVVERSLQRALLAGRGADRDAMARAVLPAMLLALSRPVER